MEVSELVNFGVAGIVLAAFLVWAKREHDRVVAERDRATEQRDSLVEDVFSKVVPAIEKATEAVRARDQHDGEVYDVLIDIRRLLERFQP